MGRLKKPEKRIFSNDGWLHYCSICDGYKPDTDFNKDKNRPFGRYYICKEHRRAKYNEKNDIDPNDGLGHIKLVFVSDNDELEKDRVLSKLGYDTEGDVHQQFMDKMTKKYGKTEM